MLTAMKGEVRWLRGYKGDLHLLLYCPNLYPTTGSSINGLSLLRALVDIIDVTKLVRPSRISRRKGTLSVLKRSKR
jgi:hypothetical protein